jgi:hypothetical protein
MDRNRAYVTTPDADTWLGAIAVAWYEQGGSFANHQPDDAETFDKFLTKLHDAAPEMLLIQPKPKEPPKLPKPWLDRVTGQPLPPPDSNTHTLQGGKNIVYNVSVQ